MLSTSHSRQLSVHDAAAALERGTAALVSAKDRLLPVAIDAKERIVPLAIDARERIVPLAAEATERIAPLVQEVAAKARPAVATAVTRVTEVVDTEVKPRLAELLDDAQRDPHAGEVTKRAQAALRSDGAAPAVHEPAAKETSPKKGHPVLKVLGLAALVAIAIAILRNVLGPRDDDWELDEDEDVDAEDDDEIGSETTEPIQPAESAHSDQPVESASADTDAPTADLGNPFRYGEGSFIGTNPPEGYAIKGNERSMKYHVPGALAYERCSTQVWFNSPEAAEKAGFVRAER